MSDTDTNGQATATAKEDKSRQITMDDGRVVKFGEKTRIKKDYGVKEGNVFCRIDFDNGKVVEVLVDPAGETGLAACGHGLSQKLGDAAAGAESTEDAYESILEVATRVAKGEWNKTAEGGTSAKGSSELVQALAITLGKDKDTIRAMLVNLSAGEKTALRKVPDVAKAIEQVRAERKPSKAEEEKVAKAAEMFNALKAGEVPAPSAPAEVPA